MIEIPNNDENENASNNIHIKKKKADLLTSIKSDLKVPKGNDLQISGKNDLQTEKLSNLIKTSENKADEKGSQTASDFAKKRIPKFQKYKTIALIATFEKPWRKKRAYDFKTFDKKHQLPSQQNQQAVKL